MKNFIYCGVCYITRYGNPFGLCNECWVKNGKPKSLIIKGDK